MRSLLLAAMLGAGCASLGVDDVVAAGARDLAELGPRLPAKDDLDPARAANAPGVMLETERLAREYLALHPQRRRSEDDYVRAWLACALLAQGRAEEAFETMRGLKRPREPHLVNRDRAVAACALHAAGLCRAAAARRAVEEMFEGRLPVEEFLRRFGHAAAARLPAPEAPNYGRHLQLEAARIRAQCFPGAADAERMEAHRNELRRMISELLHDEAAILLVELPPPASDRRAAIETWLARVGVAGAALQRHVMEERLPVPLDEEQKEWERELASSFFARGREAAARFLADEARARIEETRAARGPDEELYDRLVRAEAAVLAWINLR